MKVTPLGAGQDVGRSCIVVEIGNKTVMFDCGMHMGYSDSRKFPDFNSIRGGRAYDAAVDCVVITHFHLDHCGALPYFTEQCGYSGPIYMTHPTRAVAPILLFDYCKVAGEKGEGGRSSQPAFFPEDIPKCMQKVTCVGINETVEIEEGFTLCTYYAGHVLGAAMFHIKVGGESVVYTGDYNMSPDRHLDAAQIAKVSLDLLITESTYGSMVGNCRRQREREFVESVVECVSRGGKVLIPVFALGRAQELCLILDTHWEREGLRVPIYSSASLTQKANEIYKLFVGYANEHLRKRSLKRNPFEFKHVRPFESHLANAAGPMVLFSSPGMLHSGPSLTVFRKWCADERNLVIFPGYCVKGTHGERIINGAKAIEVNGIKYPVNMAVKNMPFSAHADQKGILALIQQCSPRHIVLVHGEVQRMRKLKQVIEKTLDIPVYYPPNGAVLSIPSSNSADALIERSAFRSLWQQRQGAGEGHEEPGGRACEGVVCGKIRHVKSGKKLTITGVQD